MSGALITIPREGPLQLRRSEKVIGPEKGARDGLWTLAWPTGSMIFAGWVKAVDWLDDCLRADRLDGMTIILAGPFGVPWLLEWYLIAANEAERDDKEGVFDAYSKSAMALLAKDSKHHDKLMEPWVKERANSAT